MMPRHAPLRSLVRLRARSVFVTYALAAASSTFLVRAQAQSTAVRYEPTFADLKYLFGIAPPVATLRRGQILETRTFDAFGNAIKKAGDTLASVKGDNPLTGPFFIDGAQAGDTIAVRLLELTIDSDQGVGALAPGFGALNTTSYTPMLHAPVPEKIWLYPIDRARNEATFRALDSNFTVRIPLRPFLGCIGVAPAGGESRLSITPAEHGGNMDAPEASAGNIVYLPVNVSGALLYIGDGHAVQGDGEIAGTAIEVPLRVRLQVDVIKGRAIRWPRFENDRQIMAVGAYRPLDDALRIAFTELIGWIKSDYGLSELDAYELLSKVATIHLTEMVDPNYVVVAGIEKRYLPAK